MSTAAPTPRRVRRYDRSEGQLLRVYRREQDGAILAEGYACSERIQEYLNPDGSIRRELITLQAVKDTARGIARAVLTFHHPKEWVSPDTYQDASVGDVDGETMVDEPETEDVQGGFCKVKVAVRRRDALQAFEDDGVVELSPGYIAEVVDEPGEWQGQRYDAKQVGRPVINHLALVPRGRGGPSIRLRADGGDAELVPASDSRGGNPTQTRTPRTAMNKLFALAGLLGLAFKADAEDAQLVDDMIPAIKALKADADEGAAMLKALKDMGYESMDALKADMGALKTLMKDMKVEDMAGLKKAIADMQVKKDAAETDRQALQTKLDAIERTAAEARLKRLADALNQGRSADQQVKLDGLDLKAQRVAVAKARLDSVSADSPNDYIDGVLDLIESETKRGDSQPTGGSYLDAFGAQFTPPTKETGSGTSPSAHSDADLDHRFRDPHLDHAKARFGQPIGGAQ